MADSDELPPKKDTWDKAKVILEPVGGLLTAIAVALLGFYGSRLLESRQTLDSNYRLYSELMSQREQSESALRKDMFQSIINSFLNPATKAGQSVDAQVLNLELLAYNFHESLNLKPLFLHLEREIETMPDTPARKSFLDRLEQLARDVTRKQMLSLEEAGKKFDRPVPFDSLKANPGGILLDEDSLTVGDIKRSFRIFALESDPKTRSLKFRMEVRALGDSLEKIDMEPNIVEFWVDFYDFPMIDNTRLSHDQRAAIVLNNFDENSADITLLEFPGSHASLQEKPYFEEIIQNLWKSGSK